MISSTARGAAGALFLILLASRAEARDDNQLWTGATATVKVSDKFRISQEVVARFSDNRNGLYEVEAVTMLGYKPTKNVTIAAGYVHNPLYSSGDFTAMEHRAREQVQVDNFAQVGSGQLSARLRLEQRWREHADGTAWRARPYIKYAIPLTKDGKTNLNLSNETFINLKNTAFQAADGVDRMRNLISISTPLSGKLGIEAGYLNQYGFVKHGDDTMDHVATVTLSLNL
ncbi:DUF2490 domain-containing protein [Sphingomonas alba]|uniref:DUF2490 domain-containing protein n=1 Tax=Sphingomonas alba TaxID=2908208 RepID=A0ABT0RLB4_9SPHN|nr:DUF2490 domain-containing protein [Sphingomonas alba]MCL6683439.1 DUF2490 domain-containing protein [Sphingomonas alba]